MSNDLERQMDAVFQDAMLHGIGVARVHLDDFIATDRNEQLEERNKELTLQLLATSRQAADALDKLAKAVEALQNISCHANYHLSRFASAVLAELEAKNE